MALRRCSRERCWIPCAGRTLCGAADAGSQAAQRLSRTDSCRGARSSPPPRRRPRSPGWCPSRACASPRSRGQLAQAGEVAAGSPRGRRPAAASSSGPATGAPERAREEGVELRRARRPPCDSSPATLTSRGPRAGPAASRGARAGAARTRWRPSGSARTCGSDLLDLAALEVADEVPRRTGRRSARAFASRSWARFSPTSVMPASASAPSSLDRHVLGRGAAARPRRDRARRAPRPRRSPRALASRFARTRAGVERRRSAPPRDARLAAGDAAVAAVREEAAPGRADRAQVDVVDLRRRPRPRAAARAAIALEVERAARRARSRRRGRRTRRGPPRRPRSSSARRPGRSPRRRRRRPPSSRSAATPSLDDARGEPAPAAVQHRHRARARPARPAGSRPRARPARRPSGRSPGRPRARAARRRPAARRRRRTVAPWTWRPCAKRARATSHQRRQPLAVLDTSAGIVVRCRRRGSALAYGPARHAAAAGGEQHARRPEGRSPRCSPSCAERRGAGSLRPSSGEVGEHGLALGVLEVGAARGDELVGQAPSAPRPGPRHLHAHGGDLAVVAVGEVPVGVVVGDADERARAARRRRRRPSACRRAPRSATR